MASPPYKIKLRRDQLAAFIQDPNTIRQMELLSRVSEDQANIVSPDIEALALDAGTVARQANEQAFYAKRKAKSCEVMTWLSMW